MGITEKHQSVATFWYHRVNEIALFASLSVLILWSLPLFGIDKGTLGPIIVSHSTAAITAVVLLASIISMIVQLKKINKLVTMAVTGSLGVALLLAIHDTGDLSSPLLALWVMSALFAAVAGSISLIPVALCVVAYAVYLATAGAMGLLEWLVFALVIVAPLAKGWFIWLRRFTVQDQAGRSVKELATELDQESTKSSIIINSIDDGVILIDAQGLVELINPAAEKIIGWGSQDADKLDYRSVLKIVTGKDEVIDPALDPIQECLRRQESIITDTFSLRTTSGKQVPVSIMVSLLSGGSGVVVVFRDITAQRAEERDQAEFVSTASHEMRTPVAAIEGYLGLALNPQTAAIDEKARMYLLKAQEAAKHLGGLFQDLLDISKAEDGRLNSELTIVNIPGFVRELLEDFRSQVAEKSLTLIYAPDTSATGGTAIEPIFYASADQSHLQEVLSNLVGNAIKYTKEGSVTVDVTADSDHVFISVKDTGIGIPAEDIPHLFQKFYRVDNTDTREIGGTGLGLYLARRLTEAMRGRLTLESVYGSGSTFTVELPRISREQAEQPVMSVTPSAPAQPVSQAAPTIVAEQTPETPAPAVAPLATSTPVVQPPTTPVAPQTPPVTPPTTPPQAAPPTQNTQPPQTPPTTL